MTGLWVPYYVSAVVGLVAFAMAFAFLQASRSADASSPPPIRRADRDFRASRAPCLDWLILLCAVNRAATAIQYIIPLLCLPSLLSEPSFDTGDPALIGENLARRQCASTWDDCHSVWSGVAVLSNGRLPCTLESSFRHHPLLLESGLCLPGLSLGLSGRLHVGASFRSRPHWRGGRTLHSRLRSNAAGVYMA